MSNKFFHFFALILTVLIFFISRSGAVLGAEPGTVKWKFPLEPNTDFFSPVLGHDNTIYVPSGGNLLAIKPDGSLKWTFNSIGDDPIDVINTPSIDYNDNIFVQTYPNGVIALDKNKNIIWNYNPEGWWPGYERSGYVAIGNDAVYTAERTGYVSNLHAIDKATGVQKWVAYGVAPVVIGVDERLFALGSTLYELNKTNGQTILRWPNIILSNKETEPAIGANRDIYIGGMSKKIIAFHPDGTKAWEQPLPNNELIIGKGIVTGKDGTLYFTSGYPAVQTLAVKTSQETENNCFLNALKPDRSEIKIWEIQSTICPENYPIVGNDGNIYLTGIGGVVAFSSTGVQLWKILDAYVDDVGFSIQSAVMGSDGTLYVDGTEYTYNNGNFSYGQSFLYAINTSSTGPAPSSWPMMGANAQHTRVVNSQSNSSPPWEEPTEQYEGGASCMGGTCSSQSIATKAVVIVHGWNSSADADWIVGMATTICQKLGAANTLGKDNIINGHLNQWCHTPQWDVWVKDWAMGTIPYCRMNLSLCLIPKTVWSQAPVIGQEVATQLIPFGYQHIHFIAHSAGSNLIHNATLQIKNQSTAPTIHETFLDAYDGWVESAESPFDGMQRSQTKYGEKADWADNYVDTRTLLVEWADNTKLLLNKVYNVDVTPQTDNCEGESGNDGVVCRHGWPYRFYTGSITGDFDTGGIMGFPLSLEAGETIQGLNDKYPLTARVRAIFQGSQFPGSYTLDKSGLAECSFSSGWVCGYVELRTSLKPAQSQSQQFSFFAQAVAATVPSQEPAWLVAQIQVTEPINNLRFAYRFAPGGEGLLRIFVDENTVREIDQRFVPAVSSEPVSIYVGDLAPGTHKIAFRLDGYGANPGGVQLTDVQLGRQTFVVENNLLTVAKVGSGNGTVTSNPPGIDCGETCSASFDSGASVSLTATPAADSTFVGWSPASCGSSPFTLTADTTCTATFNLINRPPVANAGLDLTISSEQQIGTIIQGMATDPDHDSLTYRWLESQTVLLGSTPVGTNGKADLNLSTLPISLPAGMHALTLEVNDGKATTTDDLVLNIENSAPHAVPTGGGTYQISVPIIVRGQVFDFDGDLLTYWWSEGPNEYYRGQIQAIKGGTAVELPDYSLPVLELGTHTVTLTVSDGINPPVSSDITITVIDSTAPTLSPEPDKSILWPPNHKMVNITIDTHASDNSGPPTLSAVVSSNEPQNGLGDGDTAPDWTTPVINQATGVITLQLRAERSGSGDGRVYTIEITAKDLSNNTSTASVKILVPHDKSK